MNTIAKLLIFVCLMLIAILAPVSAQAAGDDACCNWDWNRHSKAGACEELRKACDTLMLEKEPSLSAHMCMVNSSLCGKKDGIQIGGRNSDNQHIMRSGFAREQTDDAVKWLSKAELAFPQAPQVVYTQLQIFEMTGDAGAAADATERFLSRAKKKPEIESFLGAFGNFFEMGDFDGTIRFGKVIEKHYSDSHKIHGNLGGAYAMAKKNAEAKQHLLRAVELAPRDPINRWNLARLYDFEGELELADTNYARAIDDESNPQQKLRSRCTYADFLEKTLKNPARAAAVRPPSCAPKR